MTLRHGYANILATLFLTEFRGKPKGRYILTRTQLKDILDVPRLHAEQFEEVFEALAKEGYIIVDLDDIFLVFNKKVIRNGRRPPKALLDKLLGRVKEKLSPEEGATFYDPFINREGRIVEVALAEYNIVGLDCIVVKLVNPKKDDREIVYRIDKIHWNSEWKRWEPEFGYIGEIENEA